MTFYKNKSGNVLFLILITVVLFGALSYAVINSDRVNYKEIDDEKAELDQAVIENYLAAINQGQMTLTIARGCTAINYDPPSEWGVENKNCHMFHIDGAGVAYQDLGLDICIETEESKDLAVGESCGGIIYAGTSGGNRIYTTPSDQGTATWNNGTSNHVTTGATSTSDGLSNTNVLTAASDAGSPYQAANICGALGANWYLPAKDELNVLYQNRDEGSLSGTFDMTGSWYWSSSQVGSNDAWIHRFSGGNQAGTAKNNVHILRCIRRD